MDEIVDFLLEDFIEKDKEKVFITGQFVKDKDDKEYDNIDEIKDYMQSNGLVRIVEIRWHPTEKARDISKEGGWLKHLDKLKQTHLLQQAKLDSKDQLETEILKLQKDSLEYQLTIREQQDRIRNLEEQTKSIELLKGYWWALLICLGIGTYIGTVLDKWLQ
jgi:hypothetical protein